MTETVSTDQCDEWWLWSEYSFYGEFCSWLFFATGTQ